MKAGDYVKVLRNSSTIPGDYVGRFYQIVYVDQHGAVLENGGTYAHAKLELIPEEIYNSPLFKALQENE